MSAPAANTLVRLGERGPTVSRLALGASALGGVFGVVAEGEAIATVHAALAAGITYVDTAPAYGATRSERVLGAALRGVPRGAFVLSTKAGKRTTPEGTDRFAYDERSIRASVDASLQRLRVDTLDVVYLHDFDLEGGRHVAAALDTGLGTLHALRSEGRIGAVGVGIYRLDVWKRVLRTAAIDVALLHNHHTLLSVRGHEVTALAAARGVGIVNGAPFASGLLSGGAIPAWHPAPASARRLLARAAALTAAQGVPLARLALAFAASEARFPVTLAGASSAAEVARNVAWVAEPPDLALVAQVQEILEPLMGRQWRYRAARGEGSEA